MRIRFWGTRGSLPTPGPQTIKYGGNTPCVEIRLDDNRLIILDAGSGIRELGNHLMEIENGPIKAPIIKATARERRMTSCSSTDFS